MGRLTRMTAKQIAEEVMGISYHQFIKKMNRGEYVDLPHMRTGCGVRPGYLFYREKVEAWIESRMSKVPGEKRKVAS